MILEDYINSRREIVNRYLDKCLPKEAIFPQNIHRAMRYSVFAGGKRIRPILIIAGAEAVGGNAEDVLPIASAIELIHTYSLIHDDLPAMDNDDFRRGVATNHRVFGEAMAILAGDALLTLAFQLMSDGELEKKFNPRVLIEVIQIIAVASGSIGMVGGQVMDLESEGKEVDLSFLESIHMHKTGALISTSVKVGAILGGGNKMQIDALTSYGERIGLAFQIADDILDLEGEEAVMGKKPGGDRAKGKVTHPSIIGIEMAKKRAVELVNSALKCLENFDEKADPLKEIAKYIISRKS